MFNILNRPISYKDTEVADISKKYMYGEIQPASPIISQNLEDIFTIRVFGAQNKDSLTPEEQDNLIQAKNRLSKQSINDKQYLDELAKVRIFIDRNVICHKPMLKEMLVEACFASYQYQKDNNLPFAEFDKFFSLDGDSPFNTFRALTLNHIYFYDDKGDGLASFITPSIALNKKVSDLKFDKYCLATLKIITHELQHKISDKGTRNNELNPDEPYKESFNEMCTEYNAMEIIRTYLDSNVPEKDIVTLISNNENKSMVLKSKARVYKESVNFYEAINHICDDKLRDIYYDRTKNLDNSLNESAKKLLPQMYDVVLKADKGLCSEIKDYKYSNHTYKESNFDSIIDSFTSLSTKYVREAIKLDHKPDATKKEDAECLDKLDTFLDTFESISFKKKGDSYTQGEIIRERILGAVYNKDSSLSSAKERLTNENSLFGQYVADYYESQNTLGKSLYSKLKASGKLPVSKDLDKSEALDKSNSKDKDIDKSKSTDTDIEL